MRTKKVIDRDSIIADGPDEPRHEARGRELDVSRREITGILGALGLATLASCITGDGDPPDEGTITSALNNTGFIWVDTVVNLYSVTGNASSYAAIVGGYSTVGDGGGGVFFWSPTTGAASENWGTIIVPLPGPGAWLRIFSGPLNVRYFGAKGNNVNTDNVNINFAIAAAQALGGGEVYFPPGTYKTIAAIAVTSGITLVGSGTASKIQPVANSTYDTITITGTSGARQAGICIRDLYFYEIGKTSASGIYNAIYATYVDQLVIENCMIDQPASGIRINNFNTVTIENVRIARQRGVNSYGVWASADVRSDVLTFKNVAVQGDGTFTGTHTRHGVIIDGYVNTVSAYKLYCVNADGAGLWFRNTMGTALGPTFATFYGLEIDIPYLQGIYLQVGREIYFSDALINGSKTQSNVAINNLVSAISFHGGFCSGATMAGFDISGQQVTVAGVHVFANSSISHGSYSGINLNATSALTAITGNTCGDPTYVYQNYGISIFSGADKFAVVGNITFGNVTGGIVNAAGTGTSRVVASNATQ